MSTLKMLFALSGNTCYMRGCENVLTMPGWVAVVADVAHIRGENPGSARYDIGMTDEERRHFDNLMVMCPRCHRIIDSSARDQHPVDLLVEMKQQHEERASRSGPWYSDDEEHERAAAFVLATQFSSSGVGFISVDAPPHPNVDLAGSGSAASAGTAALNVEPDLGLLPKNARRFVNAANESDCSIPANRARKSDPPDRNRTRRQPHHLQHQRGH